MKDLREKLEKLKEITRSEQQRGAEKLNNKGASADGTLQGIMDTLGDDTRKIQSKSAVPSSQAQVVYPDEGFYLDKVEIAAIPISYEANEAGGETLIVGGGANVG